MSELVAEFVDLISQGISSGKTMDATLSQLKRITGVPDDILNEARLSYENQVGIIRSVPDPAALMSTATRSTTWYAGPKPGDIFWPEVQRQLRRTLPEEAIESIDVSSSKILSLMRPPGSVEFATRGLVLGFVQSGKTTSFISLAAKAADAGYRVFIVLSGITDNLRSQTQSRVDDLLIGRSGTSWMKLTTLDSDFAESPANAAALLASTDLRFVAVVKKNPARLRRLRDWLNAAGPGILASSPIVMIDDEADQASIDVGRLGGRASTINRLMKEILNQPKAAYVAYTATPFANLLINPAEDAGLYPSDFIVPLPEPAGYFGAERMFGRNEGLTEDDIVHDGMDLIRPITVTEASLVRPPKGKGSVYEWTPTLTKSLTRALRWFLLSTSARRVRNVGNPHATMLVHSSMLAEAHVRLGSMIATEVQRITGALKSEDATEFDHFRKLWTAEAGRIPSSEFGHRPIGFDALRSELARVASSTRIVIDNYLSDDRLSYTTGEATTAVVVGGNTLSRGLTLEGLSASYFVRSASAYDTLLQMGRWFGYRAGYEDLCRVWVTDELRDWFRDLSLVEAEIRHEMLRYELEQLDPTEVAVRIRTHPAMAITAAAKMRNSVRAQMSFSGLRPQTILFSRKNKEWLDGNIEAIRALVYSARDSGRLERTFPSGRRGFVGLDAEDILRFVRQYEFHPDSQLLRSDLLEKYIKNELEAGSLQKWNLIFMENESSAKIGMDLGLSAPLKLLERSRLSGTSDDVANLKAIASTADRAADLDLEPSEVWRRVREIRNGKVDDAGISIVREHELPDRGLLAVYPIAADSRPRANNQSETRVALEADANLVGLAFFFPKARGAHSAVDYVSADLSNLMIEDPDEELEQVMAADAADSQVIEEGDD